MGLPSFSTFDIAHHVLGDEQKPNHLWGQLIATVRCMAQQCLFYATCRFVLRKRYVLQETVRL